MPAAERTALGTPPPVSELRILGVPYVFARQKLKKPCHEEAVRITQRPVLCHNACGLYYIPTVEQIDKGVAGAIVCPDCNAPPKPHRIGEPEEIDLAVRMAFGNVSHIDFLRSLGPLAPNGVARRPMQISVATPTSTALVTPHQT